MTKIDRILKIQELNFNTITSHKWKKRIASQKADAVVFNWWKRPIKRLHALTVVRYDFNFTCLPHVNLCFR